MNVGTETERVEVYRAEHGWKHPYPWTFRVHFRGRVIQFGGIPNQCETRRKAYARGMVRLRWLREGTFDKRYGAKS